MSSLGGVRLEYRVTQRSPAHKRSRNPAAFPAFILALSTLAAIAASLAYRVNASRLTRYRQDSLCLAPLASATLRFGSACSVEVAQVAARWWKSHRSTTHYRLALRTADGIVDTVELEGNERRTAWDRTPIGASLTVQRFSVTARRRHVTLIRTAGVVGPTNWNPEWRADDAISVILFTGAIGLAAFVALLWARHRRRPDDRRVAAAVETIT